MSQFVWTPQTLPFTSEEVTSLDRELSEYEQFFLNPDIEKNLLSKNELLASFAISKAEDSKLTLKEAQNVYNLILADPDYDFVGKRLTAKKKLTQKDHDQLEFFNIAKTFRRLNQQPFGVKDLTADRILKLHLELTQGVDIFNNHLQKTPLSQSGDECLGDYSLPRGRWYDESRFSAVSCKLLKKTADSQSAEVYKHLSDFNIYKAGQWRDNDLIRVGSYVPAPHVQVEEGVEELIGWLKENQTIDGIAVFHTALYGLHPFNNGNKRVCRILEHILLRSIGLNNKNLYSTSYYYHKQKPRYYKYLLYSIERKNLNHFVQFILEALVLSIIGVVKVSLETKRSEFIGRLELEGSIKLVLKAFIKRGEIQFKNLVKITRGKIARQTLVTYLQRAVDQDILNKREQGRTTYYSLNFEAPDEKTLHKWLTFAKRRTVYLGPNPKL